VSLVALALSLSAGLSRAQDAKKSASAAQDSDQQAKKDDEATTKTDGDPTPPAAAKKKRRPPADPHKPWGEGVHDGTFMGRALAPVMSYLGADWLIRPERESEEEPERMLDALDLKPGMTVADVGAGVGYTSVRIARRVGPTGKVYATDIQPQMIRMLKANIKQLKLDQTVTPVLCEDDDPKLPKNALDLAIMVDVYHECTHPVETLRGLHAALRDDGRLVLVEFRAEDPEVPIKPEHKMTAEQARREVEAQGFRLLKNHDFLPWQHVLVFQKVPAAPQGENKD
jgi:protein-L-isoaspartate O-methyltransferase